MAKFNGANMWPIWGRQDPDGPHVGPMNLAIRAVVWDTMMLMWCHWDDIGCRSLALLINLAKFSMIFIFPSILYDLVDIIQNGQWENKKFNDCLCDFCSWGFEAEVINHFYPICWLSSLSSFTKILFSCSILHPYLAGFTAKLSCSSSCKYVMLTLVPR